MGGSSLDSLVTSCRTLAVRHCRPSFLPLALHTRSAFPLALSDGLHGWESKGGEDERLTLVLQHYLSKMKEALLK